ncbi:MAG: SCO2322 family protein [Nocardioides sp.]
MATLSSTPNRLTPLRRLVTVALTFGLTLGVSMVAAPAHAEDGYRYWNYFHAKADAFEFAQTGPADFTPEDGALEGWRYGLSSESAGIEPRADLAEITFDSICAGAEAGADEKRVALVIDYGIESDAAGGELPEPAAECAVVPTDATGLQTLESVTDVRAEQGGICALDGYPAKGCFETVKDAEVDTEQEDVAFTLPEAAVAAAEPTEEPTDEQSDGAAATGDDDTAAAATEPAAAEDSDSGIGWPLIAVIALVLVLGAVAIPLYRRNRES